MCTLTWWQEENAYGVYFNRDESVKRSLAQPPVIHEDGDCRYICPVDPDGGGTWIWVNRTGLIGCILNNYSATATTENPVSRGLLLKSLACHESLAAAERTVAAADYRRYRGFHLFLFDGRSALLHSWDGERSSRKKDEQISFPLTTSGYRPDEVISFRNQQFQVMGNHGDRNGVQHLERFHRFHDPDFPAHSPLMVRTDARTVSQSCVSVAAELVSFAYAAVENRRLLPSIVTTLNREL